MIAASARMFGGRLPGTAPASANESMYHPALAVPLSVARRQRMRNVFPAYLASSVRSIATCVNPLVRPDHARRPASGLRSAGLPVLERGELYPPAAKAAPDV